MDQVGRCHLHMACWLQYSIGHDCHDGHMAYGMWGTAVRVFGGTFTNVVYNVIWYCVQSTSRASNLNLLYCSNLHPYDDVPSELLYPLTLCSSVPASRVFLRLHIFLNVEIYCVITTALWSRPRWRGNSHVSCSSHHSVFFIRAEPACSSLLRRAVATYQTLCSPVPPSPSL